MPKVNAPYKQLAQGYAGIIKFSGHIALRSNYIYKDNPVTKYVISLFSYHPKFLPLMSIIKSLYLPKSLYHHSPISNSIFRKYREYSRNIPCFHKDGDYAFNYNVTRG